MNLNRRFSKLAGWAAQKAGQPAIFAGAVGLIVVWGISGPLFGFSDTWQLVINTLTTVITFLMVFLIQTTQNRDTAAIHIKLNELIRISADAQNALIEIENLDEDTLLKVQKHFAALARCARDPARKDVSDPAFVRALLATITAAAR